MYVVKAKKTRFSQKNFFTNIKTGHFFLSIFKNRKKELKKIKTHPLDDDDVKPNFLHEILQAKLW